MNTVPRLSGFHPHDSQHGSFRCFLLRGITSPVFTWVCALLCAIAIAVGSHGVSAADETSVSSAQNDSRTQVFRSVGKDGVVEFNDNGDGELVNVDVPDVVSEAEVSIVRDRQRDILEVAQLLSSDRSDRDANRFLERERAREAQARFEQQELAALRAADSVYYPSRRFGFSPFLSNRFFANGRRRNTPRFVYEPGPDHPSNGLRSPGNGLRHPGARPPPAAPAQPRRSIQRNIGRQ